MKRLVTEGHSTGKSWFVRRWVTSRLGGVRHERRVSRIAGTLLETTDSLHQLTRKDRRLLKLAALVHDVGRCVDDKRHPEIGAEMIRDNTSLPLSTRERRALAYLTLHHRGPVPEAGHDDVLRDSDDHQRLMEILAFLRAADGLDSRNLAPPQLEYELRRDRLVVTCRLRQNSAKARRVFARKKKFRLLRQLLGIDVEVNIITPGQVSLAA